MQNSRLYCVSKFWLPDPRAPGTGRWVFFSDIIYCTFRRQTRGRPGNRQGESIARTGGEKKSGEWPSGEMQLSGVEDGT